MVQRCGRPVRIDPAAGKHDVCFLDLRQANRTILGVSERQASAGNIVDPGLQRRIDAEIDEPGADDEGVRGKQLVDELIEVLTASVSSAVGEAGAS